MTHYQVFLPPSDLAPLASLPRCTAKSKSKSNPISWSDIFPLELRELCPPVSLDSSSQRGVEPARDEGAGAVSRHQGCTLAGGDTDNTDFADAARYPSKGQKGQEQGDGYGSAAQGSPDPAHPISVAQREDTHHGSRVAKVSPGNKKKASGYEPRVKTESLQADAGILLLNQSTRLAQDISVLKRARGGLRKTQSEASEGSRRKSARLSRGGGELPLDECILETRIGTRLMTASLMPTLPMLGDDTTGSLISFNTTLSSSMSDDTTRNDTQNNSGDQTTSVHHLPKWTIPLSKLTTLPVLLSQPTKSVSYKGWKTVVSLLVCLIVVEEPVLRQRKEEKLRGREGSLWVGNWVVIAPPDGTIGAMDSGRQGHGSEVTCAVKLWEGCAKDMAGGKVRRGDVLLLESE